MAAARILAVGDQADFELLLMLYFRKQIRVGEFSFVLAHHGEKGWRRSKPALRPLSFCPTSTCR